MKFWAGEKPTLWNDIMVGKEKSLRKFLISLRYYSTKIKIVYISKVKQFFVFFETHTAHLLSCSLSFTSFPFLAGGKCLNFLTLSWISSKRYSGPTRQVS